MVFYALQNCLDVCVCACVCELCAAFCAYVPKVSYVPHSEYLCLIVFTASCVYGPNMLLLVGCVLHSLRHCLEVFVGYI